MTLTCGGLLVTWGRHLLVSFLQFPYKATVAFVGMWYQILCWCLYPQPWHSPAGWKVLPKSLPIPPDSSARGSISPPIHCCTAVWFYCYAVQVKKRFSGTILLNYVKYLSCLTQNIGITWREEAEAAGEPDVCSHDCAVYFLCTSLWYCIDS